MTPPPATARDRRIADRLARWFERGRRDLPWRRPGPDGRRDPWRVLVSEIMLQQTQVSRVAERFEAFMDRFPTAAALAGAGEGEVLAAWSGLGYYRRARLLHAAGRAITERQGGRVPGDPAALRALPGVGAYTAGAVASLAFGLREPAVDGNAVRVVLRLEGEAMPQTGPGTARFVGARVRAWLGCGGDPGVLNESIMELGATVCTPAAPDCGACPVSRDCLARERGAQEDIPPPKPRAKRRILFATSLVATDADGRVLLRQRPAIGLWASMWEPPTVERGDRHVSASELVGALGLAAELQGLEEAGVFTHITTHREVRFRVFRLDAPADPPATCRAVRDLAEVGIGTAQRRVLETSGWGEALIE